MQRSADRIVYSATDLSGYLACPHLAAQNRGRLLGLIPSPPKYEDPGTDVLRRRGEEHEQGILERYRQRGLSVVEPRQPIRGASEDRSEVHPDLVACAAETIDAMRSGADVIYQAVLYGSRPKSADRGSPESADFGGPESATSDDGSPATTEVAPVLWLGRPDFLARVETPSHLGDWSYEVVDAKLSRSAKAGAVLQTSFYSELLEWAQGGAPEFMHLALGGPGQEPEQFRVTDFGAYYRSVRRRFAKAMAREAGHGPAGGPTTYPEPCEHCDLCDWRPVCRDRWRAVDHLSLVAGITRKQRDALEDRDVPTRAALGGLPLPADPPLDGVGAPALERIREQARIQVEGEREGRPKYELLDGVADEFGLGSLPAPCPGDLFFDIEGDPHAVDGGLEYLLGWVDGDGAYDRLWGLDPVHEKVAFEAFIDRVTERMERWPDMRVYHYNHYEPTALKKLAGRHATREQELDDLLRGSVFVDLYRVVRQGIRASVESYSLKKLEPLYGYERDVELRLASRALANFEAFLGMGGTVEDSADETVNSLLDEIARYNRDDCLSTLRLRDWLEERREELEGKEERTIERWDGSEEEQETDANALEQEAVALRARLHAGLARNPDEHTPDERVRALLGHALSFHRREDRASGWEYHALNEADTQDLIESRKGLGGLEFVETIEGDGGTVIHRYRFPEQHHRIERSDSLMRPVKEGKAQRVGSVVNIDDERGLLDLRPSDAAATDLEGVFHSDYIGSDGAKRALLRLGEDVLEGGVDGAEDTLAVRLLLGAGPDAKPYAPSGDSNGDAITLRRPDETNVEAARRIVPELGASTLAVQGPPGAGKTHLGAHLIVDLLRNGLRVGVSAHSHKAIGNLLKKVCETAETEGVEVRGRQKSNKKQWCGREEMRHTSSNPPMENARKKGLLNLLAGTRWLWSRVGMADAVDVLVIDEAGQISLANVLAMTRSTTSIVLLGDPQQLQQPTKATHPGGSGTSALDHLLGGAKVMPLDRGLFLERTWRLHPDLCDFTSEQFYDSRLKAQDGTERQRVDGPGALAGTGLRFVPVAHEGNTSDAPEEVEAIELLVDQLLDGSWTWTDTAGATRELSEDQLLVIAPYNAQVARLRAALRDGIRVGTVDKLQGQQATVVLFSTTSSSTEDAPRGMDFLFDAHRLNVATSRGRCVTVVVGSPRLFEADCSSVEQMRLANGFCRMLEMAGGDR